MPSDALRFAVLGTGNSGHAFAADIALKGFSVNLADVPQFEGKLAAIRSQGGIEITGEASQGFARLNMVTTDLAQAIDGVDIIMVGAPANAHEPYARALAPYFQDGQYIVFVSNFAALRFRRWMIELGVTADVVPVEAQSLVYATRSARPGSVEVFGIKSQLSAAALPASRTADFIAKISPVFPQFVAAESVLSTSLNNYNPVVHPAMTLLNAGRIEATQGQGWNLYRDGATESVAGVMAAVDRERMALASLLGVGATSLQDSFATMYRHLRMETQSLSHMLRNSPVHANPALPGTPSSLHQRYITEDVPYGLVPWASMGRLWSTPTPTIDALVQIASVVEGIDYFEHGVTAQNLGIAGLTPPAVQRLVAQ